MRAAILIPLFLIPLGLVAQSGPSLGRPSGQIDTEYLWRQAVGGAVIGLASVQAASIAVALDGGNLKAYGVSGRPLWNFSARGRLAPFLSRSPEGTCYLSRTSGAFIAVNRVGRELWRINPGGPVSAPAAIGWDGRLFIPTEKRLSCVTAAGSPLWNSSFEERIVLGPVLDRAGGVLFALEDGVVIRASPFGELIRWELESAPLALISVAPAGGQSPARPDTAFTVLAFHRDGSVVLLETAVPATPPRNLTRLSALPLAVASYGDRVAVALANGAVALISGIDGKVFWSEDSHVRIYGDPAPDQAAVLFNEWGVYAFTPGGATCFNDDGKRRWYTHLQNASGLPAFDDEGILYSGGKDWILYAWKMEDRPPGKNRSLYGPAPEGNYGGGSPPPSEWANYPGRFGEMEIKRELEIIRRGILTGRVGGNELEWVASLMETVAGNVRPLATGGGPQAPIMQRILALQLLARIGSRETIPWLVGVFRRERDPALRAEAARAIGVIGVDPSGIAIQEFLNAASGINSFQEGPVLVAVAAATGALCRFSGPPLVDIGSRILTLLSAANQPPAVQRQAHREIGILANENR